MLYTASRSVAQRSFIGSYFYLLVWFVLIIPNQFYLVSPAMCFWFTTTFILFAAVRVALLFNFEKLYAKGRMYWIACFYPVVLGAATAWGILHGLAIIHEDFKSIELLVIISTACLVGGGITTLLPSRFLTVGFVSGMLAPSTLMLLSTGKWSDSLTIIILLYWVGLCSVSKTPYREYWSGLRNSFLLKQHARELKRLNALDGLTGLKNRNHFDLALQGAIKTAIRNGSDLSLLLIDIDHFKKINDKFGHLFGDTCLRELAKTLAHHFKRETDTVARYGGEEFAIILTDTGKPQAMVLAEKLRKVVEQMTITSNGLQTNFTISIGVSSAAPGPDFKIETLIEEADVALYAAKNSGRNMVK